MFLDRLLSRECVDATYRPSAGLELVLDRGEGSFLWDVEGRRYIDLCAGFGSLVLGHQILWGEGERPPALIQGMGDVYPTVAKIEFMESLLSKMPPFFERAAFASTGSQAVEYAMKTAMLATAGSGFLVLEDAYHGLDFGALSLVGREDFRQPFESWLHRDKVRVIPRHASLAQLEEAVRSLEEAGVKGAAVIIEPIQGRAGVRPLDTGWLRLLYQFCHKQNMLLIYDEIMTGWGRTGSWTLAEDAPCDLICLGKGLGGGMPLSACLGRKEFMDAWPVCRGEAIHTGTFFGHPLAAWLGVKTLQRMEEEKLCERARVWGAYEMESLSRRLIPLKGVKELRGRGLMWGIEFDRPHRGAELMGILRKRGVIAIPSGRQGEVLSLTPALNIPEEVFHEAIDIVVEIISKF